MWILLDFFRFTEVYRRLKTITSMKNKFVCISVYDVCRLWDGCYLSGYKKYVFYIVLYKYIHYLNGCLREMHCSFNIFSNCNASICHILFFYE